ncbi:Gfo/Idh/MocA family protein [Planomicrobium sp. MB-3u-38]|uniref:Gfo/Idh/MocA family protein n=1 Tax=Planomicrobium sp. MB-3u-38 TaxID=2058318 RepID=UPI000C7DB1D5|nr:Gfo/Idh/MocA family oxidoreductase [Planomicrobium sp. MB-3u-38]PKH11764.1 gfo/Idh/MocA family oxidoreductase [Planomicrobium sp. MB-3u-38]
MISIGIIGAGIVGERIIKQIQQENGVEIIGVFDENSERLQTLKQMYDVPLAASLDEIFYSKADWVYIGTPPASHAAIAKQAADAGLNVLSEKPLAHNAEAGEQMVAAITENRVRSAMHFPLMYSPAVHEMAKRSKNGSIGEIIRIELQTFFPEWPRAWQQTPWIGSRLEGGFIREVFPHYLQLIHRIFGDIAFAEHHVNYPDQPDLCETGLIAYGLVNGSTPLLLTGLSGVGQEELLQFKIYGTKGVLTLENWSQLYLAEKGRERIQLTGFEKVTGLFEEMKAMSTALVPFEEGLVIQRYIDQLTAE